eukprot:Blabericola_migrator_1__9016@NODE_47_length_16538_cov_123_101147_g43_i0_p6_GENE_NODE_47_length_16538_cov_123_101147_g43_i0NODE_47_length_16538_cov_123_101147_g43_i0_p6_ORF_typecomplete_len478_score60_71Radical_SAM/PF04055_21/1_4e19Wyosine_form/PF08608_12/1_3e18Fer4_12/PF13353_6/4e05Fer4_14/PF13394_6/1_1e04Fer4_14/PF13394_6/5_8e05HAD_2/PF13419_6/0_074RVT_1/PF00078_27/0_17Rb_C/PF08934_10/5_1e02Rb_C/PF08934_10/1_4_NODE_47_length_16538_cov_123_101147_g43_i01175713190
MDSQPDITSFSASSGENPDSEEECEDIEDIIATDTRREMITDTQRKVLEKQGYRIVGSHSAVKLCRWTKHHLRGQGGCYKYAFYGIVSSQCMECTSSLACANRCVFCWRHHKNPVGTYWRWEMDEPKEILEQAVEQHQKLIKAMKGVPGVAETGRLESARTVKHCALSLVGEPIMYPKINEFLEELHRQRISTFLVTNAQFPDALETLTPCTQLYVSIDGSTPEQLKKIDRPLFRDYWERFTRCLIAMRSRPERTVYRLTLVKEYNDSEIEEYVKLVALGHPDMIELKGVTFAGHSRTSGMMMSNVPRHKEVTEFALALNRAIAQYPRSNERPLPTYDVALEHEHSCSVLLANTMFKNEAGVWCLWIDFEKFFGLCEAGKTPTKLEYSIETPSWALYNSPEKGFAPSDKRYASLFGVGHSCIVPGNIKQRQRSRARTLVVKTLVVSLPRKATFAAENGVKRGDDIDRKHISGTIACN